MIIERLSGCTEEFMLAINLLMPQLTTYGPIPHKEDIIAIINDPHTSIWIVRDDFGKIAGMLTLAIYRTPTGVHAWIEDVVVEELSRGKGYGKSLTARAIDHARENGAKAISLTSRPNRIVANQLYQKMGFEKIETNLYRKDFK